MRFKFSKFFWKQNEKAICFWACKWSIALEIAVENILGTQECRDQSKEHDTGLVSGRIRIHPRSVVHSLGGAVSTCCIIVTHLFLHESSHTLSSRCEPVSQFLLRCALMSRYSSQTPAAECMPNNNGHNNCNMDAQVT